MKKSVIHDTIVEAWEKKFSFLGKQVAEEVLMAAASWNIQQVSKPDYRIRRHVMLYWQAGYLKSSLLCKAYDLFGADLSTKVSDITLASLRGTVEAGRFVSPYTLKRPFSICTEFGQILRGSGDDDLIQKLLNVLEEGTVTVSLGKISMLSKAERARVEEDFPVRFIDANTFAYDTNWVMIAGTYKNKYLVDGALESRFNIITPEQPLGAKLTRHVIESPPFELAEEVVNEFRQEILSDVEMDTKVILPSAVYEGDDKFSPRDAGMITSHILCKAWWGKSLNEEEVVDLANRIKHNRDHVWKSADDKVFDVCLDELRGLTVDEIGKKTKLSTRQVFYSLKKLGLKKSYDEEYTEVRYSVK